MLAYFIIHIIKDPFNQAVTCSLDSSCCPQDKISLSPIFFILGRLGLEMTCMAIIEIILKKTPIAIRMTQFSHNYAGVLGSVVVSMRTASIPPWKPYLNGERYMMG